MFSAELWRLKSFEELWTCLANSRRCHMCKFFFLCPQLIRRSSRRSLSSGRDGNRGTSLRVLLGHPWQHQRLQHQQRRRRQQHIQQQRKGRTTSRKEDDRKRRRLKTKIERKEESVLATTPPVSLSLCLSPLFFFPKSAFLSTKL